MTYYRYSLWDGSQQLDQVSDNDLMSELAEYLMANGNLQDALRMMLRQGMRAPGGERMRGIQDLLEQLRQQKRRQLERYNLTSIFDDLEDKLNRLLKREKEGLERRLEQARTPAAGTEDGGDIGRKALENLANRKQEFLSDLPEDAAGKIRELTNYEFVEPESRSEFQEILEALQKAALDSFFKDISQAIQAMTPEDLDRIKQMAAELNQMLEDKRTGGDPDFESFMDRYGDLLGDDPPQSLEQLVEQMQRQMSQLQGLMESLPRELRDQLQQMMAGKMMDPGLQRELAELAAHLEAMSPNRRSRRSYPFRGDEDLSLSEAMELMRQLQRMDDLEKQLEQSQYRSTVDQLDRELIRELMGEDAAHSVDQLQQVVKQLEDAGFVRRDGDELELTARATRAIGQRALGDIFTHLRSERLGRHPVEAPGGGGDPTEISKPYEFGDAFFIQIRETIMNAVRRGAAKVPVPLEAGDFEVQRTEQVSQTSTVLMLDLSLSMAYRGNFLAAKKMAIALDSLIRTQFPRDNLYVVGFSARARQLKSHELPFIFWDEDVLGTNIQHALRISQRLLSAQRGGSKQIIMVTDGEPTAHHDQSGHLYFEYPPSRATFDETLREAKRCTQKGIVINTFMLDRSFYLKDFVNRLTRINKGRAFYTSGDQLGQYILVDYVVNKRRRLSS